MSDDAKCNGEKESLGKKKWVQEVMGARKKREKYGTEGREQSQIKSMRKAS